MPQPTARTVAPPSRRGTGAGTARTGGRGVTLRDVAQHCGLSVYPVSRVLSGKGGVTAETVAKVNAAATALGYDPLRNLAARRLALRKSGGIPRNHVIGLLLPGHLGKVRFFYDLFRGVAEEVSAAGYGLLSVPTYDPVAHCPLPIHLPPSVWRGEVDALIVHQALGAAQLARLRAEPGFGARPIVSLAGRMAGCAAVLRDERGGARLALAHLLALGHRRILYLRKAPGGYPVDEREVGYGDACTAAGVTLRGCLRPVFIEHDHEVEEPLRQALAAAPDLTALLALNDPNALHACYALQRLGVHVPADCSVVGWDDTDPWPDPLGRNRLTSVAFDIAEMGRAAARLAIGAVEGAAAARGEVTLPARLSVRQSTAPPRGRPAPLPRGTKEPRHT